MTQTIKIRNEPAQHIGVVNSAPCPEMNIIAKEITENGRYEARAEGATGFDPVIVNVPSREEIGYENGYAAGYDEGYDKGYEVAGEYSVTAEDLAFGGDVSYLFQKDKWTWIIDRFGDLISFNNVTNALSCFETCGKIVDLSNISMNFDGAKTASIFASCQALKKLPKTSGSVYVDLQSMFSGCAMLTSDEISKFLCDLEYDESSISTQVRVTSLFSSCSSVRDLTTTLSWLGRHLEKYAGTSSSILQYNYWFNGCYALDEITNIPVVKRDLAITSNIFSSTFSSCMRAKNIMFQTNNGNPYLVKWKSQTIDLSAFVGYSNSQSFLTNYNSGISSSKMVSSGSTYNALKNDPDWFTIHYPYSRYNHDSAVNTINSLPDTSEYLASAGGTNTIKFKGASGSSTDGGAISNLTAEEIAVATAKGWTVTLT